MKTCLSHHVSLVRFLYSSLKTSKSCFTRQTYYCVVMMQKNNLTDLFQSQKSVTKQKLGKILNRTMSLFAKLNSDPQLIQPKGINMSHQWYLNSKWFPLPQMHKASFGNCMMMPSSFQTDPEYHGLRTPNEAFFHQNPKLQGLGKQCGKISLVGIWGIFG